jgi:hypothetical protein
MLCLALFLGKQPTFRARQTGFNQRRLEHGRPQLVKKSCDCRH